MNSTDREVFAHRWANAIAGTSYVSMRLGETVAVLRPHTDRLIEAALAPQFDPAAGSRIGSDLVAVHFTSTDTISKTLALIIGELPHLLGSAAPGVDLTSRVALLSAELAAGYAGALRERSLDEQDKIYRAGLRVRKQAEQALASSEARFRQVFYASPLGIAINEPGGTIVECNRALENILGYSPGGLLGHDLSELFLPGDRPVMAERYQGLATGRDPRLRIRFPLRNSDGEQVWVNLNSSALPDGEQAAHHIVTMVDDISDLQLLEQQLHHQTLHDAHTGLPNRRYLLTHLEQVLARLDPSTVITLMHLDLDGFSAVNDGMGHRVGDQMLEVVARRLEGVVADRPGMVARLGDDEYAVFLESADPALDANTLAEMINAELAEPHYVDETGLALTATIGVVQRRAGESAPEELVRDASSTLRRLRGQGPGQWAPFDTDTNTADRAELQLAAEIPGAQETGQLHVTYQPVVTLAAHQLVGIEAALCWEHPHRGRLSHEQCVAAAQRTGSVHAIGEWWLRTAAQQAVTWRQHTNGTVPPMVVNLTPSQAQDPELIATVTTVLAETGLPPAQLELRAPVAAIRTATGEFAGEGGAQAEDNLRVLAELGLRIGVHDFGGGIGGLRCQAELTLCTVRLTALVSQQITQGPGPCPILSPAMQTSIHSLRAAGIDVVAYPIDTAEQAVYCTGLGANWALGALFGTAGPPEQLKALLDS
ncbi:MAG: putative bifunctional diguanylate cyclase/phosphodiesterase [Pseudonocardiaceae bacterium]